MSIYINGKRVTAAYINGKRASAVYMNGERITLSDDYLIYEYNDINSTAKVIGMESYAKSKKDFIVNIPYSVTNKGKTYKIIEIGDNAFLNCSNVALVTCEADITKIGTKAFMNCSNLQGFDRTQVSDTVVGDYGFCNCSKLVNINTIYYTEYGERAFYNSGVVSISCWDKTTFGEFAFGNCMSLNKVTIYHYPSKVLSVFGNYTFYGCTNLKTINFKGYPEQWALIPFNDEYSNPLSYGHILNEFYYYGSVQPSRFDVDLTEGIDGEKITEIPSYAFVKCSNIDNIYIPSTLKSVGRMAFYNSSLSHIYYAGSETMWKKITKGQYWDSNTYYTITYNYQKS